MTPHTHTTRVEGCYSCELSAGEVPDSVILGLDISSKQLNGCLLVDEHPPMLQSHSLGKGALIDRLRRVPEAMEEIAVYYPTEIVIEDAYGPSRTTDKALWGVIGAIIAWSSEYPMARVTVLRTDDWRRELGAKDTKPAGHEAVFGEWDRAGYDLADFRLLDEHELDACGIALAWKHRLEAMANE